MAENNFIETSDWLLVVNDSVRQSTQAQGLQNALAQHDYAQVAARVAARLRAAEGADLMAVDAVPEPRAA